jgi:hypothetical protein
VNEKFNCEATIFASWQEDMQSLKVYNDNSAQANANEEETDEAEDQILCWNSNNFWDPKLYIDNSIGEIKEKDVKYRIEVFKTTDPNNLTDKDYLEVHMIKRIQGTFFEKLELYHFPFDIQDLSLTISSYRPASEILLVHDYKNPASVS